MAAIRLLIFTGARCGEIEKPRWEWVQEPRLMLTDSKTGPRTVWLAEAAQRIGDLIEQSMSGTRSLNHNTKYDRGPLLHD